MLITKLKTKMTNIKMTDRLSAYLAEKLAQLERVIPKQASDVACSVELGMLTRHHKTGNIYRAEINIRIGKTLYRAEETAETIESAIDLVKNEIKAELTKMSSRSKDSVKAGGRLIKKMIRGE